MSHMRRRQLRRRFDRLAARREPVNEVEQLVADRLLEHLDPIRLEPARVLDLGTGSGALLAGLATRFPGATLHAVDLSAAMAARVARQRLGLLRRVRVVQADAERLPLRSDAFDLIVTSNLLPWCELGALIGECARLLREGGLLLLATPGPETLSELRGCALAFDGNPRVAAFVDLHDLADALLGGGFRGVVSESERLTLLYPDLSQLHAELRALGAAGARPAVHPGLSGRAWAQALRRDYEHLRRDGRLPATYEVVYAHAWRGLERARGPIEVRGPARRRSAAK